jgi:glucans biosynthesis protein C
MPRDISETRNGPASIALSNLRAVTILIVITFHSILAYLASLPAGPYPFDSAPYRWVAFPVVDSQRWFGFDLFCAWLNLSMMALMFLLAGLFTAPSLAAKGPWTFLADRFRRIGLPLLPAVILLAPLTYYAAFRTTAADPSFSAYVQSLLALPFWPTGPQWFLWELLAFTLVAALLYRVAPGVLLALARGAAALAGNPFRFYVALVAVSAVAYVPLTLFYSQWSWTNFGPVAFETTRPLLYLVFFFAGAALGARGLGRGLLDCEGLLARRWWAWLLLTFAGFSIWGIASSVTLGDWDQVPVAIKLAAALGLLMGCASGCFFMIGTALRFLRKRRRVLDSLSQNAYRIYLLHYLFAIWLQYALLGVELPAIAKGAIVFAGTLLVSWPLSAALGSVSLVARPLALIRSMRSA